MAQKSIDYNDVLNDLKSKRSALDKEIQELDGVILSIKKLTGNQPTQTDTFQPTLPSGVYEASAAIIARRGIKMETREIFQELIDRGVIEKDRPFVNVSTTLYKAAKTKKDCKIKRMGAGVWGLSIWK